MACGSGYKLVTLANGVHSVHSLAYGETFHPVIGPVAEAEALYVRQIGLAERLRRHSGEFVLWDVGLGAAANAVNILIAIAGLFVMVIAGWYAVSRRSGPRPVAIVEVGGFGGLINRLTKVVP